MKKRIFREEKDTLKRSELEKEIPSILKAMKTAGRTHDREVGTSKLRQLLRSGHSPGTALFRASRQAQVPISLIENEISSAITESIPELAANINDDDGNYDHDNDDQDDDVQSCILAERAL